MRRDARFVRYSRNRSGTGVDAASTGAGGVKHATGAV
jgi:hypothetical protein